jgi:hypothetical protein
LRFWSPCAPAKPGDGGKTPAISCGTECTPPSPPPQTPRLR